MTKKVINCPNCGKFVNKLEPICKHCKNQISSHISKSTRSPRNQKQNDDKVGWLALVPVIYEIGKLFAGLGAEFIAAGGCGFLILLYLLIALLR